MVGWATGRSVARESPVSSAILRTRGAAHALSLAPGVRSRSRR
jgi:hypothetical protein